MPKEIRVFDIVNGHRVSRTVTIDPLYKVRFLGFPTTIKYEVAGVVYSYGYIADLVAGEYAYKAYVPVSVNGDEYAQVQSSFILSGGDLALEENLSAREITLNVQVIDNSTGSPVPDAPIFVDGVRKGFSTAGFTPIRVSLGQRVISASKDAKKGFVTGNFTLANNNANQVILLSASTDFSKGFILFKSEPSNALLRVNNVVIAETTPTIVENLNSGLANFTISKEGYRDYTSSVTVPEGSGVSVIAKLEPIATTGTVNFTSNQESVGLYLDGAYKGAMPVTLILAPGIYRYSATKTGFNNKEPTAIAVEAGVTYPIYVEMNAVQYAPRGQFIKYACQGFDRYQELHDGNGGTMLELVETNSAECNFPQTKTLSVTATTSANIEVLNSNNVVVQRGTFTGREGSFDRDVEAVFNLAYGTYTLRAIPVGTKAFQYDTTEQSVTLAPSIGTESMFIDLKSYTRRFGVLVYTFKGYEPKISIFGDTNGFGGVIASTDPAMFEGYARTSEVLWGGGTTFSIQARIAAVGYDSGRIEGNAFVTNITTGKINPFAANTRNVSYKWNDAVYVLNTNSGQGSYERVRSSEFKFNVEGWAFTPGSMTLTISVPVEYWTP